MIYYINNQSQALKTITNHSYQGKVTGKDSLLQYIYQKSNTAHIFPTYYEKIGRDLTGISITGYLILTSKHRLYHRL